ncbi:MAG: type IV pilus twitching motility protein PilT, partial [Lachnospiraceae bacterium]
MLINDILKEANDALASDVHITVGIVPRMRVFGTMISMNQERITKSDTEDMAFKMMTEKQKKHLEKYGEIDIAYSIPNVGRYRVNIFKQRGTITLSLRLVGTKIPDITKLGIPKSVMDLYSKKKGLVLVTGPTGSGKSTTIASIIDYMNHHRAGHIITLEDPIEYLHCHEQCIINQREIGIDTLSYQNGLHAALREDPDVIFVGELRDYETISLAITAAETGHLVLSTMHTTSVEHTIERMID